MVNEEKYFDELQKIIGDTKSADGINDPRYLLQTTLLGNKTFSLKCCVLLLF